MTLIYICALLALKTYIEIKANWCTRLILFGNGEIYIAAFWCDSWIYIDTREAYRYAKANTLVRFSSGTKNPVEQKEIIWHGALPQVTTVTKVVREVSHMEPDPGAVSYMSVPLMSQDYQHADPRYPADPYMVSFDHYDPYLGYPPQPGYPGPHGIYMPRSHSPHSPHSPSEHSRASPPHGM